MELESKSESESERKHMSKSESKRKHMSESESKSVTHERPKAPGP
jgi:hypothetical protein